VRVIGLRKIAASGAKYKVWERFVSYGVKRGSTYTNHVAFKRPRAMNGEIRNGKNAVILTHEIK
jgi:hypothetical protein